MKTLAAIVAVVLLVLLAFAIAGSSDPMFSKATVDQTDECLTVLGYMGQSVAPALVATRTPARASVFACTSAAPAHVGACTAVLGAPARRFSPCPVSLSGPAGSMPRRMHPPQERRR